MLSDQCSQFSQWKCIQLSTVITIDSFLNFIQISSGHWGEGIFDTLGPYTFGSILHTSATYFTWTIHFSEPILRLKGLKESLSFRRPFWYRHFWDSALLRPVTFGVKAYKVYRGTKRDSARHYAIKPLDMDKIGRAKLNQYFGLVK